MLKNVKNTLKTLFNFAKKVIMIVVSKKGKKMILRLNFFEPKVQGKKNNFCGKSQYKGSSSRGANGATIKLLTRTIQKHGDALPGFVRRTLKKDPSNPIALILQGLMSRS